MSVPAFAADYRRPDLDAVRSQTTQLAESCSSAGSADEFVSLVNDWNTQRCHVDTLMNIAMVRYAQDTTDEDAKSEKEFWDGAAPVLRELEVLHARTLLASPHRDALDNAFGKQLAALKECMATTCAPEIKDAIAQEARLCSQYTELVSKPELDFRGDNYSMSGIIKFFTDADRQVRLESQQARGVFLDTYGEQLDNIYDELVSLRHSMGTALGHDNFIPLGYQLMSRTSYGPDEVATFRDAIREAFVPIATELAEQQRRDLGVDRLLFHDEPVIDKAGNPRPVGDMNAILDDARTMYHELGGQFGGLSVFAQPAGPVLEGGRLGQQLRLLATL